MEKFENSLPMMLHRTLDAIIPEFRKVFKAHNITEQQWRVLRVLWELDECMSSALASQTLIPSPSMVGVLDRMSDKNLVYKARSNTDRRVVHVKLSEKGRKLRAELQPQVDSVYSSLIDRCDDESWKTMINTLKQIIDPNRSQQTKAEKQIEPKILQREHSEVQT